MGLRFITPKELTQFDGRNGRPAYFACHDYVYDVSASFSWRGGVHQVLHKAGCDLTEALKDAPHGLDLFETFPVVGKIFNAGIGEDQGE